MTYMQALQPGGLFQQVNSKILSYNYAHTTGFAGGMASCAHAGGIRHHMIGQSPPFVVACRKGENAPYAHHNGGAAWFDSFKNVLGKIVSGASTAYNAADKAGLTTAVGNLINNSLGPAKAPIPVAPGAPNRSSNPGLNQVEQGVPPKRSRFGGGRF